MHPEKGWASCLSSIYFRLPLHTAASQMENCPFCGSAIFLQSLVVSTGNNTIDRIVNERVAFIRSQHNIVSGMWLLPIVSILHRQEQRSYVLVSFCRASSFCFCFLRGSLAFSKTPLHSSTCPATVSSRCCSACTLNWVTVRCSRYCHALHGPDRYIRQLA